MKDETQKKYRKVNYRTMITSERIADLKRKYGDTIGEELKADFINMCDGKPTKLSLRTLRELGVLDIYNKFTENSQERKEKIKGYQKKYNKKQKEKREQERQVKRELKIIRDIGLVFKHQEIEPERIYLEPIDIEPKWINLIPILLDLPREYAISELNKLAKLGDEVRQAQKNKEKIVYDFREAKQ